MTDNAGQNPNLKKLSEAGVSVWLDDLSRDRLQSGNLAELIATRSIVGVTTNPSIFQAALSKGHAYDAQVNELASRGADVDAAIRTVTTDDVRNACDVLAPQYEASKGVDGRVSIEVDPRLAHDTEQTIAQAIELWKIVNRPNLLIKIPATKAGVPAIAKVIGEGISVNVTLIFSVDRYQAVMGAYLDGLEDGLARWGPDTAHVMRDQTDRLVRLAEDIDDVSRAEEGRLVLEKSPDPVDDLLYAASRAVASTFAEKGVALITIPTPATLVIDVDRERFAQVLGNLLGNALRHTPRDGTVTVFAEGTDRSVVVTVTDTGEGMTVEQLPHVFERFYRGDNARDRASRGSGIGLTISKAIVDAHGGTLTASSPGVGLGSTFAVTLPTS